MHLQQRKDSNEFVEILYTDSPASFTAKEKGQGISFDAHLKFKCVTWKFLRCRARSSSKHENILTREVYCKYETRDSREQKFLLRFLVSLALTCVCGYISSKM